MKFIIYIIAIAQSHGRQQDRENDFKPAKSRVEKHQGDRETGGDHRTLSITHWDHFHDMRNKIEDEKEH